MDKIEEYISRLPEERVVVIKKLRSIMLGNLPKGFEEMYHYNMIGYSVPKSRYPSGYHVDGGPLPFLHLASQKSHVALYHSGIYAHKPLLDWFVEEYPKHSTTKLNMGKSCIRFKNINKIPYNLIAELCQKMTVEEWIEIYESNRKRTS